MKRSNSLFLTGLLFSAAMSGCDAQEPSPALNGEISFLLDGEPWAPEAEAFAQVVDYGILIGVNWPAPGNPMLTHVLNLAVPDLAQRQYPIARLPVGNGESGRSYGLMLFEVDYDAIYSTHTPVDEASLTGGFTITRYDSTSGEIEATFEATVGSRPGLANLRTLPDTFRISQGRLKVKLFN